MMAEEIVHRSECADEDGDGDERAAQHAAPDILGGRSCRARRAHEDARVGELRAPESRGKRLLFWVRRVGGNRPSCDDVTPTSRGVVLLNAAAVWLYFGV